MQEKVNLMAFNTQNIRIQHKFKASSSSSVGFKLLSSLPSFLSNLCQTVVEREKKNRKKIKKHNGVKYDGLASGNDHNFLVTNNVSSLSVPLSLC